MISVDEVKHGEGELEHISFSRMQECSYEQILHYEPPAQAVSTGDRLAPDELGRGLVKALGRRVGTRFVVGESIHDGASPPPIMARIAEQLATGHDKNVVRALILTKYLLLEVISSS